VEKVKTKATSAVNLFCSETALLPQGFAEAFPAVCQVSRQTLMSVAQTPDVIWLRLHSDSTVAVQVAPVKAKFPQAALVVMSDIPNDLEALAAFSVLAKGYCNAHAGAEVLLNIANVVQQGGLWIGESIMQKLIAMPAAPLVPSATPVTQTAMQSRGLPDSPMWDQKLSSREREVAQAIAVGASNKEVAQQMGITERTVKAHVGSVLEKLQLKNRLQLALLVKDR
jgi:DNA-binding NarL/FixJ family response regulator